LNPFEPIESQPVPSPAAADFERAKALFDQGEFPQSYEALLSGLRKDAGYPPLYPLAAETAERLGGHELQSLLEYAGNHLQDAGAFHALGEFYFDLDKYATAEIFYKRAFELDPNYEMAAHDLALTLARQFRPEEALEVLNDRITTHPNQGNFWEIYVILKLLIFTKYPDLDDPEMDAAILGVEARLGQDIQDPETRALYLEKFSEVWEARQRAIAFPATETHIRDWQFIQYGSILLDCHDDGDTYLAGGRYALCWGTQERILSMAHQLKQLLRGLEVPIQGVAALSDRDSEILGRLFAKVLEVPFSFYSGSEEHRGCLVVASRSSHLVWNACSGLSEVKNGQILFALDHDWLNPAKITPDIIGLMSQRYHFPWAGGGLQVVSREGGGFQLVPGEGGGFQLTVPDQRPAEDLASEIFALQVPETDIQALLDFYAKRKPYLKGIGTSGRNLRYEFSIESPVPGSFFE